MSITMSSKTEKIQKSAKSSTFLAKNCSMCVEVSEIMCIFAIDKSKNVMGIKRNKLAEPQWDSFEYAKIDKGNLFSYDL